MSDELRQVDEIWAEEGGMRLRVEAGEHGRVAFSVVDVTVGWPGAVLAKATLASFRVKRLADELRKTLPPPGPPDYPRPKCHRCGHAYVEHDRFGNRDGCAGYMMREAVS